MARVQTSIGRFLCAMGLVVLLAMGMTAGTATPAAALPSGEYDVTGFITGTFTLNETGTATYGFWDAWALTCASCGPLTWSNLDNPSFIDGSFQTILQAGTGDPTSVSYAVLFFNIFFDPAYEALVATGSGDQFFGAGTFSSSAVPEPPALLLFAIGLLGLAGYRWAHRRREGMHIG